MKNLFTTRNEDEIEKVVDMRLDFNQRQKQIFSLKVFDVRSVVFVRVCEQLFDAARIFYSVF
jgi:hypothetical protein